MVKDFGFTLDQVNWLSNVTNVVYLPASAIVPLVCSRWGIRRTCDVGAIFLVLAAWIRYAGTAHSLSKEGSYALIMVAQILGGFAQPFFQVLPAKYSETWFDLKGRTTATMVMSVANPIGGAIGQILSPSVGSSRQSILVLAILGTAVSPLVFLIQSRPPTPPTYAASQPAPRFSSLIFAIMGTHTSPDSPTYMTRRERIDFAIIFVNFGIIVGIVNAFSILTSQFFQPYGYSDTTSGLFGAVLLLVGLVFTGLSAPLFDRVLTHHLGLSLKVLSPIVGAGWLSLIWAVKPNDTGALFAVMAIIGAASLIMLPVVLELAVELTRNADGSSAMLWFSGNLFAIMYVLVANALRASESANPPLNMHRALIFQASLLCGFIALIPFIRGKQRRREMDERVNQGGAPAVAERSEASEEIPKTSA